MRDRGDQLADNPRVRAFRLQLEAGASWHDQAFGWAQLFYARSGVARVETDDSTWTLPVWRALWIPPDTRHLLRCRTSLELSTLYFHPDHLPIDLPRATVLGVEPLLHELIGRLAALQSTSGGRAERLLAVVADELWLAEGTRLQLPMPNDDVARQLALRILGTQAPGARSLAEWCADAPASRRTLERRFADETGVTLGAWFRMARLHAGLTALAAGGSVGDAADTAGYSSSSAFVVAFRDVFGTTPARYVARSARY